MFGDFWFIMVHLFYKYFVYFRLHLCGAKNTQTVLENH